MGWSWFRTPASEDHCEGNAPNMMAVGTIIHSVNSRFPVERNEKFLPSTLLPIFLFRARGRLLTQKAGVTGGEGER